MKENWLCIMADIGNKILSGRLILFVFKEKISLTSAKHDTKFKSYVSCVLVDGTKGTLDRGYFKLQMVFK